MDEVSTSEFNLNGMISKRTVQYGNNEIIQKRRDSKERKSSREGELRERELVVAEEILD